MMLAGRAALRTREVDDVDGESVGRRSLDSEVVHPRCRRMHDDEVGNRKTCRITNDVQFRELLSRGGAIGGEDVDVTDAIERYRRTIQDVPGLQHDSHAIRARA